MFYNFTQELMSPPTDRPAFSDRRAYLCAQLSRLAYFKFEGGSSIQHSFDLVEDIVGKEKFKQLETLLGGLLIPNDSTSAKKAFEKILSDFGFTLEKTFNNQAQGTQAFLCTRKEGAKTVAFLVFRGTEKKYKDVKTDMKCSLSQVNVEGFTIDIHSGFLSAFQAVEKEITTESNNLPYDQLFITGHSLGGALAIITTVLFKSDMDGACYTFGAPAVGYANISRNVKTPIYEIINQVDIVPRLPSPWVGWIIVLLAKGLRLLAKFVQPLNWLIAGTWDEKLESWANKILKYRHSGYLSYLIGNGKKVRLRYNFGTWDKIKMWLNFLWSKNFFRNSSSIMEDHKIDNYINKLQTHGLNRNQPKGEIPSIKSENHKKPPQQFSHIPSQQNIPNNHHPQ